VNNAHFLEQFNEGSFAAFSAAKVAFAALPVVLVDGLFSEENRKTVIRILTYRVAAGSVYVVDVTACDAPAFKSPTLRSPWTV